MKPMFDVVVVIPWRHNDEHRLRALRQVHAHFERTLPGAPVLLADDPLYDRFNVAAARNAGVRLASQLGARAVVVCDADTLVEPGPLHAAIVGCADGLLHLPFTECQLLNRAGLLVERKTNSTGGVFVIECAAWDKAGGQDVAFRDWGFEDIAFRVAVEAFLGRTVQHPGAIQCIWHPRTDCVATPEGLARNQLYLAAVGDRDAILELQGRQA